MSAERLFLQLLWQEAAEVELDGLCRTRDQIRELVAQNNGGSEIDYPRLPALDAEIKAVERSIAERSRKIERMQEPEAPRAASGRLALLLQRQEEARVDRQDLLYARDCIQREADDLGLVDFNDDQDHRFRELTNAVRVLDEEIQSRDEEIDSLAAFSAVKVN